MTSDISWFSPYADQWEGFDYRYERFHFLVERVAPTAYALSIQNSHDTAYGITLDEFGSLAAAQYAAERFGALLRDLTAPQPPTE